MIKEDKSLLHVLPTTNNIDVPELGKCDVLFSSLSPPHAQTECLTLGPHLSHSHTTAGMFN